MATLSSSLVHAGLASMQDVEAALARQVMHGGDLVTNLLEVALVDEARLLALLADHHQLPAGPTGPLPLAGASLLRLFAGDLAERHAVYPLRDDGLRLHLAVAEPLPPEVEETMAFSLGTTVAQVVSLRPRILQAVASSYQRRLPQRMARLAARLDGRPDPAPSNRPPPPNPGVAPAAPVQPSPAAAGPLAPEPVQQSMAADRGAGGFALSRVTRQALGGKAHKRRGPYTAAMAEADLEKAASRDDVVRTVLDYCSQFFERLALFSIRGEVAECRALRGGDGPGVGLVQVPLGAPSVLRSARDAGSWQLLRMPEDGIDGDLARALGREPGRVVFVAPITVRGRSILALYGDHGSGDVDLPEIGDVLAFLPLVTPAIERIIVTSKGGPAPPRAPRRPVQSSLPPAADRAAALQAALADESPPDGADATSSGPAPTTGPALPMSETPNGDWTPAPLAGSMHRGRGDGDRTPAMPHHAEALRASLAPPTEPTPAPPYHDETVQAPEVSEVVAREDLSKTQPSLDVERLRAQAELQRQAKLQQEKDLATRDGSGPVGSSPVSSRDAFPPEEATRPGIGEGENEEEEEEAPTTRLSGAHRVLAGSAPSIEVTPESLDAGWSSIPPPASSLPPVDSASVESSGKKLRTRDVYARVDRLIAGDRSVIGDLLANPETAATALVARFPGPLSGPLPQRVDAPPASSHGPVLELLARLGKVAVPFIMVRTGDGAPEIRAWATRLLGEIPCIDSARAIQRRFVDRVESVRRSALAAGRLLQTSPEAKLALREGLLAIASDPTNKEGHRHAAVGALMDLRDARAIPQLIKLLDDTAVLQSVRWALREITRAEPGKTADAWQAWWAQHQGRHRVEWVIDALSESPPEQRRAAAEELAAMAGHAFGYREGVDGSAIAEAQERARAWWRSEGHTRFA